MVNHPNRNTRGFRFIAYNMVTQNSLAHADTAAGALDAAAITLRGETDFLEVLDCGTSGRKVWQAGVFLHQVRADNLTVFRGGGYAPTWLPVDIEG